ncbi:predicted protein [Chaetomium globosum CBS 148.51]|uniref:Uncharacterized protein n=1 Tax=Chaetomium globosum (strain ATCC 6205 / CBS 148.51 / DSM 1962 / NBRC 6347 / NRRL 1970) TaxID=306901 RepID=Q2HH25_CHAGB|nr:uncharacterized protein CHGG_00479 [Chaetomium globosum CBS 148.51]EAQ92244.1 predicted protein [Chaetomium globosum CBS 148.51]
MVNYEPYWSYATGYPVLQVLEMGSHPMVLQEVCAVPALRHSGPWGRREGGGSPMPNPRQRDSILLSVLLREAPGLAQEEASRSSRQGKLTFARKVDTDLTGCRGDGVGGLGVTTPEAADSLEADGQDVGMQGAG